MHNPEIPYLLIPASPEQRFEFSAPVLSIGREAFTSITLADPSVSRRHCRFYRVGNTFWVQDWYSTSGTLYKDARVTKIQGLLHGEGISQPVRVGEFDVHVQCPAQFAGDPVADLDEIEAWIETLDNDFPDYVHAFWAWSTAMRDQLGAPNPTK